MASIANATIRIGATAEDVAAAVSSAIGHFQRLNSNVASGANATIGQLKSFASQAALIFGGIKIGGDLGDAVQKYERALIAFEVMLKSKDKARQLIKDLQAYEFETPMKFTDLTGATQRLLALQYSLEDIPSMLRLIGDAASASGDNVSDAMERIIRSIGGMKSRGYMTGEEVRELVHANIPVRKYLQDELSKQTGRPVDGEEVSKMIHEKQVDSGTAHRAILGGFERDYGGIQRRVGTENFEGLFKRIVSQAELAFIKIAESMDKTFGIKKYLNEWVDTFAGMAKAADGFGETLNRNVFVKGLILSFQALKEIVSTVVDVLVDGFKYFNQEIGGSSDGIASLTVNTKKVRDDVLDFLHVAARGFVYLADAMDKAASGFSLVGAGGNILAGGFKILGVGALTILGQIEGAKALAQDANASFEAANSKLQGVKDNFGGNHLERELANLDEYFAKMHDKNRDTHSLAAQLGIKEAVAGLKAGNDELEKFHRKAKDLVGTDGLKQFVDPAKQKKLLEDGMTPIQKLKTELQDLADDLVQGKIGKEAYDAGVGSALMKASKGMKGKEEFKANDAITSGSAEAQRILAEARNRSVEQQTPDLLRELIRDSEKQTQTIQDLLQQVRGSGLVVIPVG